MKPITATNPCHYTNTGVKTKRTTSINSKQTKLLRKPQITALNDILNTGVSKFYNFSHKPEKNGQQEGKSVHPKTVLLFGNTSKGKE